MKKNKDPKRKHLAILMRRQGKSYNEINKELGVAKSTLSAWLKDVPFSEEVKRNQLYNIKQTWVKNIREFNRKRHDHYLLDVEAQLNEFACDIPTLTQRDLFFLAMGLYWGEGSKKTQSTVVMTNSDPKVILASLRFFTEYCRIKPERIQGGLNIHPNIDRDESIEYWSHLTGIPSQKIITQVVVSSASKGKRPKNNLPYGTFRIIIKKASFYRQIMGWLRGLQQQF